MHNMNLKSMEKYTFSINFHNCTYSYLSTLLLFSDLTFSCTLIIPTLSLCQKYVQDALREQLSETVYQCLREEGGHIYVCGDVTMAGDVLKTVQHIIKQQGKMSLEDAGFFISKLRVRESSSLCNIITMMFLIKLP